MVASLPMLPQPSDRVRPRRSGLALALTLLGIAGLFAACGAFSVSPPAPTPADFQGVASGFVKRGITIDHIVSGDAGCADITLQRTAIGLDAGGLGQQPPRRIYLYVFRNADSLQRLRQTIDICARTYVTDPQTFESVEASPYVVAGQGPWPAEFRAAIRAALIEAAGPGG
jgi:hypothetical protein